MAMELLFAESLNDMTILGVKWLIPLMIIFISIILITRNTKEMKLLFFPVTVGYATSGLLTGKLLLIVSGIMFSVEVFGFSSIGNMVRLTGEGIGDITERIRPKFEKRTKLRTRIKEAKQERNISRSLFNKNLLKGQIQRENANMIIEQQQKRRIKEAREFSKSEKKKDRIDNLLASIGIATKRKKKKILEEEPITLN